MLTAYLETIQDTSTAKKQKRGDYQVSGNHYANYAHRLLTTNVIVHAEYF